MKSSKVTKPRAQNSLRICIATSSVPGYGVPNEEAAGISGLAQLLAAAGHYVNLLWVPDLGMRPDEDTLKRMREESFEKYLVNLEIPPYSDDLLPGDGNIRKRSLNLYHCIRSRHYDVLYFAIEGGLGYYSLLAKHAGTYKKCPRLCVIAQSPTAWRAETTGRFLKDLDEVASCHMEQSSVELSDSLICGSDHLLRWMKSSGWKLPEADVLLPISPYEWSVADGSSRHATTGRTPPTELIFFTGEDERARGLLLLCDVLDSLAISDPDKPLTITMIGPFGHLMGEHTGGLMLRRGRNWPFKIKLLPRVSPAEGLSYARSVNCVVIFPSLSSSSNLFLASCVSEGIPLLATTAGSNTEFISAPPNSDELTEVSVKDIAKKLCSKLANTAKPTKPSLQFKKAPGEWVSHPSKLVAQAGSAAGHRKSGRRSAALISVVITHHDRPNLLAQAVKSVEEQDYPNIEVVLVDDGSVKPDSMAMLDSLEPLFKRRKWKILRQRNKYLGAARNAGIKASRGERILFLDDDNALFKSAISTLSLAMENSGADICTALQKTYFGDRIPSSASSAKIHYYPLGGALSAGYVENMYGDANALCKKEVFRKIGGFVELRDKTGEDWEFFARATLNGLKVQLVPEPVYWYRSNPSGMWRTSSWVDVHKLVMATYKKHRYSGLDPLLEAVQSGFTQQYQRDVLKDNLKFSPSNGKFVELADIESWSDQALELLATIAASEGRIETALNLLAQVRRLNARGGPAESILGSVGPDAALAEMKAGWISERRLDFNDLRQFRLGMHIKTVTDALFYVEHPGQVFLQARPETMAFAVLKTHCPAGTTSATTTASLEGMISSFAEFMVLLVPDQIDPLDALVAATTTPSWGCSGWCAASVPGQQQELTALLEEPSTAPLTLVIAVRTALSDSKSATLGCFSNFRIKHSVGSFPGEHPRIGPPKDRRRARELSRKELSDARLLTKYDSKLPLLLIPPEGGLYLRPSPAGPVAAVIDGAFPAFADKLIASVEITHEEASPFEFATGLAEMGRAIDWSGGEPNGWADFSGWTRVERKFSLHEVILARTDVSPKPMSIILAIRLPRGSKDSPANSYFRQLIVGWHE